jgi:hypothetical protein
MSVFHRGKQERKTRTSREQGHGQIHSMGTHLRAFHGFGQVILAIAQFFAYFNKITDSPSTQPDPSQPMSEYEELNCVYKSQIGTNSLIYGAEIDGLKKREDLDNLFEAKMVELKTCRQNPNPYSFSK